MEKIKQWSKENPVLAMAFVLVVCTVVYHWFS